jgi:hypothetical protein|tara:strand:- start:995 stop:1318 length:324 start_codon:yes stop_codon:yes gene_type:complete
MKNKQIKYQILELLLEGHGTRMEVWNRNPKVCSLQTFKRTLCALRWEGLIQHFPPQKQELLFPGENVELEAVALTIAGLRTVEEWRNNRVLPESTLDCKLAFYVTQR